MSDTFDALADPTRREILVLLSGRRMPAGEIARRFPQQRPAVSKHLSILKRAGLLDEARERQRRIYSIRGETLRPVIGLLRRLVDHAAEQKGILESKSIPRTITPPEPAPRAEPRFELEFD